jgi:hypothetical protein
MFARLTLALLVGTVPLASPSLAGSMTCFTVGYISHCSDDWASPDVRREPPLVAAEAAPDLGFGTDFALRRDAEVDVPVVRGQWNAVSFSNPFPTPGLALDPETGRLSGKPSAEPGTVYVFQVVTKRGDAVVAASGRHYYTVRD